MNGNALTEFDILYENNSTTNYLVLTSRENNSILNYQVQMLLNNRINGLLEFNLNCIGNELNCFYNITSKCTLANFMSRKKFSRNEFLVMLLNVINNVHHIKKYLLYDYNVLLDVKFIYVEPEKAEIYFVYLPFTREKNDFKAFLLKLIVEMVSFYDEDSDNYIQRILEAVKSDLFSLSSLKALIESLLGQGVKSKATSVVSAIDTLPDLSDKNKVVTISGKNADKKGAAKGNIKIPQISIKNPPMINDSQKETKKNNNIKVNRHVINFKMVFLLLQPILLILYFMIIINKAAELGGDPRMTAVIIFIIFICIDILIFRVLNDKFKEDKKDEGSEVLHFITNKMRIPSVPIKAEINSTLSKVNADIQIQNLPRYHGETEIIRKPKVKALAYLKEIEGDEIIELNKKSILIGRMESFVDTVLNCSAIGKIHAEIVTEDGEYYLIDCNSKNGTFINDKRITSNTRNKVSNNDLVRFANKEFKFFNIAKPKEVV